ncbi:MAG TPA: superoxide dismutase family protein, partial [Sulfitobacter pontiacus]|nr:superoxide dismutase family protein [Sulfitobacter pontiacus]
MKFALTTAVACGLMTSAAFAAETTAPVMDAEGAEVGTVTVQDTESGVALAKL